MSKLINEDWEHAAYANDEMYRAEREHRMMLEHQEWKHRQNNKKKPAIIKLKKYNKDEAPHKSKSIQRTDKEEL
jgi:hypothetical protein